MMVGEFSSLRAIFFPIHRHELKKFLPLSFMLAFILFNFWILHNVKDSLVVAAHGSGSEVINFLKVWGVLPIAFGFFLFYTYLANVFRVRVIFYGILTFFGVFFLCFAFFIYPNAEALHLSNQTIESLKESYPRIQWFMPLIGHWTYSVFYIVADLWGSIVLAYLFWQFANQITKVEEAQRFYALFNLIGTLGIIGAGLLTVYFSTEANISHYGEDLWGTALKYLMSFVAITCFVLIFLYRWMHKKVLTDPKQYEEYVRQKAGKKRNVKLSFRKSLVYIFSSKYIMLIFLITIGFQISINLIEVSWKDQVRQLHDSHLTFNKYMGNFTINIGLINIVVTIISANIIRMTSWLVAALVTPIILLVTGALFFFSSLAPETMSPIVLMFGMSPLAFSVWLGKLQGIFAKSTKNILYNATREMVYIPLDDELKIKGKAAIDVVAERFGKSGGAAIQQILLIVTAGTQKDILPFLCIIVMLMLGMWIYSIFALNRSFMRLVREQEVQEKQEESSE
jgi:ATP:ADP antiporter, AAA family